MSVLLFALMTLAGIGAAVGMRVSRSGSSQGRALATVCAVLAVALAGLALATTSRKQAPKMAKALGNYSYASGEVLGRHLAETCNGGRALVLVEPSYGEEPDLLQVSVLEGLEQGMGSAVELVGTVAVDPPAAYIEGVRKSMFKGDLEPPEGTPEDWIPYLARNHSRWFNAGYLASVLAAHKGTYDVLVSTVGLPRGFDKSRLLKHPDLPKTIAVLNAPDTPMRELIHSGIVDVLVANKPSSTPWKDAQHAPGDVDEAFAKRFFLVTSENMEEVAQADPKSPNWR